MRRSVGTLTLVIGFLASCGGGAGTEDPARADAAEGGALDASTEAGDGTSACTEGTSRCEDKVPVTCAKDGSWRRGAPCPYGCASGACSGLCVDGQKDCDGNVPLSCTSGTWQRGAACAGVCTRGVCESSCVSGDSTCAQSLLLVCVGSSAWDTSQRCPYVCRDGACQGDCIPGAKQCAGDGRTPQVCGADGTWQGGERCAAACTDGTCTEGCVEGSAQCSGRTLLSCANGGTWGIAESCASVCTNGACRGECSPGAIRCGRDGTSVESCDGQGQWAHARTCAHGCEASGRCAASPEAGPDGAADAVADAKSAEDGPGGHDAGPGAEPSPVLEGGPDDAGAHVDASLPVDATLPIDATDGATTDRDAEGGPGSEAGTDVGAEAEAASDAASDAGPLPPLYTCAFVGPRRILADLASTEDIGQAQVAVVRAPTGGVRVAYTGEMWDLVVAAFEPTSTSTPTTRTYSSPPAVASAANRLARVASFSVLHKPLGQRRYGFLPFAPGKAEEIMDIADRPTEEPGRMPGGMDFSPIDNGDAAPAQALFAQTIPDYDAGVARYYAAKTTLGNPVVGSYLGEAAMQSPDIAGVMAFPTRGYMIPRNPNPQGVPLYGFPNRESFVPSEVTLRTLTSSLDMAFVPLLHERSDNPRSYDVIAIEMKGQLFRFRLGVVTENNVNTFTLDNLALLAETTVPGSPLHDIPLRTEHGLPGIMIAGPLLSPVRGFSIRWYDTGGRPLVVPDTDTGGTQPDLLPGVAVRTSAIEQDTGSPTPRFHAVWRAPTGAPGRDGIYFDNFECKP